MVLPDFHRTVRMEFVGVAGAESLLPLLELERREFEAVLGQSVELSKTSAAADHAWQVVVDPEASAIQLRADLAGRRLLSVVPSGNDLARSLNLLHALAHSDRQMMTFTELDSYQEVVARVRTMISNVYPSFRLRGLDWSQICARYEGLAGLPDDEFWEQTQRWVAELGDAHTAILAPDQGRHPPYVAEMTEHGATLHKVPPSSSGHRAGARPGSVIHVEDPDYWLATTGASDQHHRMVAARRFMQIKTWPRRFTARTPEGHEVSWEEAAEPPLPSVTATDGGVRISRFGGDTPKL